MFEDSKIWVGTHGVPAHHRNPLRGPAGWALRLSVDANDKGERADTPVRRCRSTGCEDELDPDAEKPSQNDRTL